MGHEVFTEPWARAWAGELRASDAYRRAARTWEGSLLLEMAADAEAPESRAVYADLWRRLPGLAAGPRRPARESAGGLEH